MEHKILKVFEDRSLPFWITANILLVGILGFVDFQTGNEYSFSLFYLIPISLTAWYMNLPAGIFTCILSAATWLAADIKIGEDYSHPITYFWNFLIRLGFFLTVNYLLSELHKTQKIVETLARTDHLTGTINFRYFHELLAAEIQRTGRYKRAFTLVYLDLDNFKGVNDKFGHGEGDNLIAFIAHELQFSLRMTDIVSRLGGDEFAILFPETGQQEAKVIMEKLKIQIAENLRLKYPFVTFSAGVVTFTAPPETTIKAIKIADDLMYSIKNNTKNGIQYSIYTSAVSEKY